MTIADPSRSPLYRIASAAGIAVAALQVDEAPRAPAALGAAGVTFGISVLCLFAVLRRRVVLHPNGLELRGLRTRRMPWSSLDCVYRRTDRRNIRVGMTTNPLLVHSLVAERDGRGRVLFRTSGDPSVLDAIADRIWAYRVGLGDPWPRVAAGTDPPQESAWPWVSYLAVVAAQVIGGVLN